MNKSYFFVFISAVLLSLTRIPLSIFSFFSFISLIPLYHVLLKKNTVKSILLYSVIFAFVYNLIVLHWISLVTLGGYLGMFLLFSFYYFVLFFLINRINFILPKLAPITFTVFFISFEYLQNFGEFSFPWFNLGYSLAPFITMIQAADIGGVFFISFLMLTVNLLIYYLFAKRKRIFISIALFIVLSLWFGYGKYRLKTLKIIKTDKKISVIQGNIPLDLKWEKNYFDSTMIIYKNLSLKAKEIDNADLVIWPESAITDYFLKNYKLKKDVVFFAIKHKLNIFTGFEDYDFKPNEKYRKYDLYNAASQISQNGDIDKPYYKIRLVPFGERMPFLKIFPFLWNIQLGQANFNYGKKFQTFQFDKFKYGSMICFEIAFPFLSRVYASEKIDFMVNITNDAWFKKSIGTYQHKIMTVFRAIEIRKQIFRAANTGYSVIVYPTGKIAKSTKLYDRTFISDNLYLCNEKTIFTKYLYIFPFVLSMFALLEIVYLLLRILRVKS